MTDERRTSEFGDGPPVIRDRRRIDPVTGQLREPREPAAPTSDAGTPRAQAGTARAQTDTPGAEARPGDGGPTPQESELTESSGGRPPDPQGLVDALAERTADLQRLQAEYVNYKRRVDRDREVNREIAVASVLSELLHTLDDIGRARDAGELEGAFKAVAESVERVAEKAGLVRYGEVGDAFDPRIHEALMHNYSDEVDGPTCTMVMQPGYRLGERILRPARVAVSEPTEQLPEATEVETAAAPDTEVPETERPDSAGPDTDEPAES